MNKELGVRIKIWSDELFHAEAQRSQRKPEQLFHAEARRTQRETEEIFHAETQGKAERNSSIISRGDAVNAELVKMNLFSASSASPRAN